MIYLSERPTYQPSIHHFTFWTKCKSFICDQLIWREAVMQFNNINLLRTNAYIKQCNNVTLWFLWCLEDYHKNLHTYVLTHCSRQKRQWTTSWEIGTVNTFYHSVILMFSSIYLSIRIVLHCNVVVLYCCINCYCLRTFVAPPRQPIPNPHPMVPTGPTLGNEYGITVPFLPRRNRVPNRFISRSKKTGYNVTCEQVCR